MSADDWSIPNYILNGDNCSHNYLNHYKNRIDLLNGISKGRAVTTCANRKEQSDALKKALDLNHERDDSGGTATGNANDVNFDFNSNLGSSSSPKTKVLPDKYFCEGSPDKLMMEALKELNINDIKDFLMAGGPETSEQFEKEKRAPPPQYHLESSRGDVKDRLTSF